MIGYGEVDYCDSDRILVDLKNDMPILKEQQGIGKLEQEQ